MSVVVAGGSGAADDGSRACGAGTAGTGFEIIETSGFGDYELIDSGGGRKLERFGEIVVDRPEPQALWAREKPDTAWGRAHAVFSASGEDADKGKWRIDKRVPERWPVQVGDVNVSCRLQGLWHLGLFPEQMPHWQWMLSKLDEIDGRRPRVLNLFGYTGAATLLAARAGASVTHVDASKKAILWAKDNQAASGLSDAPVRWILDDAAKFVAREVRREKRYDVILVDPPKFGRGPSGETWDLFTSLPLLLSDCAKLLDSSQAAMVLTVYAIRASGVAFDQLCQQTLVTHGGSQTFGELVIRPREGGFGVPTSLFVRWQKGFGDGA